MLQILDEYIEVSNKKNYFLCKFCKTWKGVIIHVKWGPISKMFLFYICMHTETYSSWILYMFAVLILNSAVCKMCSEAFLKCLCHLWKIASLCVWTISSYYINPHMLLPPRKLSLLISITRRAQTSFRTIVIYTGKFYLCVFYFMWIQVL